MMWSLNQEDVDCLLYFAALSAAKCLKVPSAALDSTTDTDALVQIILEKDKDLGGALKDFIDSYNKWWKKSSETEGEFDNPDLTNEMEDRDTKRQVFIAKLNAYGYS
ncbi:MAG: hypothetical protein K2Q45_03750 [Nitrosomonas sp.]|nr:hypothetical protein [Nitrosomonas sp.]